MLVSSLHEIITPENYKFFKGVSESKKEKIRKELADVLNYCILMADTCGLDMDEIIQEKVRKNGEKYPVEKAYGHKEKYTELGK